MCLPLATVAERWWWLSWCGGGHPFVSHPNTPHRIIVPIVRGYGESGHFTFWSRLWYSVKENLLIYGVIGGLCAVYIIYAAIKNKLDFHGIYGMAIAMSNAFGLLVVMILLGYGLVEVPRFFFKAGNRAREMDLQAFKAVDINEDLVKTQESLNVVLGIVQSLDTQLRKKNDPEIRHFVDVIIDAVHEYYSISGSYSQAEANSINLEDIQYDMGEIRKKLIKVHERAKASVERYKKERIRWRYCQDQYQRLEDLIEARAGRGSTIGRNLLQKTNRVSRFFAKISFAWHVYCVPAFHRTISVVFMILSAMVLWCEITMFLASSNFRISVFSLMMDAAPSNFFLLQMIVLIPLVYVAFVCYFALFRAKLFSFYEFVPHYSDNQTMLFNALFVSRFTLPICYNLLMFVHEEQLLNGGLDYRSCEVPSFNGTGFCYSTGFSSVLGVMDVVPLLGKEFNIYFPIVLLILIVMNLFSVWSCLFRLCGVKRFTFEEHETKETVEQGRHLLLAAIHRRQVDGDDADMDPLSASRSEIELSQMANAQSTSPTNELPDNHPLKKFARLREERSEVTLKSNVDMKKYSTLDDILSKNGSSSGSGSAYRDTPSGPQRSVLDRYGASSSSRTPGINAYQTDSSRLPTTSSSTLTSSSSSNPVTAPSTSSAMPRGGGGSRNILRSLYED